ncbi:hypothetical protein AB0B50_18110 [Streptomyces sp. NPDC041068]|uniref:hypothetical protein n=1 Tax=Streptomyces sp. NPDC041068 TaxID=3155130 RepID=UPI0033FB9F49
MSERHHEGEPADADEAARLREELRALGRSMDAREPGGETMAERVIAQILAERAPVPVAEPPGAVERLRRLRRGLRMRWRTVTAALCGLLTVLALTPPVRAAVFDWFDFGGVEVRYDPSATPSAGPGAPGCADPVSVAQARRLAGFTPAVPKALGAPDAVSVTREPGSRVLVSLCWREGDRTIRLDEYGALLDPGFAKTVPVLPDWVEVGEETGLWFARPHRLTLWLVEEDGDRWRRTERTAGPTLLWTRGQELTLRLEGVASKERALEIAESVPSGRPGSGT